VSVTVRLITVALLLVLVTMVLYVTVSPLPGLAGDCVIVTLTLGVSPASVNVVTELSAHTPPSHWFLA
jgi:hypothetical protein